MDPHSGKGFIEELAKTFEKTGGKLASIIGRYYAMDRDKRWERVKKAYDLLLFGKGKPSTRCSKKYKGKLCRRNYRRIHRTNCNDRLPKENPLQQLKKMM